MASLPMILQARGCRGQLCAHQRRVERVFREVFIPRLGNKHLILYLDREIAAFGGHQRLDTDAHAGFELIVE